MLNNNEAPEVYEASSEWWRSALERCRDVATESVLLGPLPKPWDLQHDDSGRPQVLFTADQMRSYAVEQVVAERERCAKTMPVQPACMTCSGHGMVGGLLHNDDREDAGYERGLKSRVPLDAINKMLADCMGVAAANGANSVSMPDHYVEVAAWICGVKDDAPSGEV